jgi:hypothetical protein
MAGRYPLWVAALMTVVAAAVIVRFITVRHSVNDLLSRPIIRAHGKPNSSEIAIRVRNVYLGKHPVATCTEPTSAHWTCTVRLADGQSGEVRAVWSPRTEKLAVVLTAPGFHRQLIERAAIRGQPRSLDRLLG